MVREVAAAMAELIALGVGRHLSGLGEPPELGPFRRAVYDANADAGAGWDARQAVRKALARIQADRPAEALELLGRAAATLPDGPDRAAVAALAERLGAATAG